MQSSHYYAYTCEPEESAYMHIQGRGLQLKVLGYYCVVASVLGLVLRSFLSAFFLDFLQLVHRSMHFDDMKHPTFTKWMLGFELCVIESGFFPKGLVIHQQGFHGGNCIWLQQESNAFPNLQVNQMIHIWNFG